MSQPSPDEMQRNIEEIAALRASTRNWRLGMILGILIIVITCVMLIGNSVRALAEKGPVQEALLKDLKTGMETQVVPPVKQLAQRTMRDLEKSLKKEADKAAERAPEIMEAFNKELETLQTNIPKRGEEVLKSTFGAEFKRREKKIQQMFPGITDQKISTVVDNIIGESHASMEHLSHVLFGQHTKALNDIFAHLETIQKTEKVDPKDEATTYEIALAVFDLVRDELSVFEKSATNAPPARAGQSAKQATTEKKESK
jgi:low affinity Fe/Cu permease/mRNA-degrading endonuclease YafQ of YafQ-DinJ toxin-antitoxin module